MEILELKEKLIDLRSQWEEVLNAGEAEKRELNAEETDKIAEIRSEMDEVEAQIKAVEEANKKLAIEMENRQNNNITNPDFKMENVKLINLINGVVEGRNFDEAEAKYMSNARTINTRGILAGTAGHGQENVPEDKMGLDVAIRNASVLNKLGCTWFGNAVGDISLPHYAGSSANWKGEVASADTGDGAFSEVILQPKRLTSVIYVSKEFLRQDSNDAEAILVRDLAEAIAQKFDETVFGDAASAATKPAGIFYSASTKAVSAMTYEDMLALEEGVEENNGVDFIFVTNPKIKYQMKGTQLAHGLNMVYSNGEIDGVRTVVSNSVKGIACLDPRDLAVATWGGVELTIDTDSRAEFGEVKIVANAYVDAKLRGNRIAVLGVEE